MYKNLNQPYTFPSSLWASVTVPRKQTSELKGVARTDVVVIGGGYTGLSTALHLIEHGRSVVILEAAAVGWGASGRNSGQVIPTLSGIEPDAISRTYGETGERFVQLVSDSANNLFDLIRREGITCEAEQTGWFQPAHSPARVKLSAARVEAWAKRGAAVSLLDASETANLIGSKDWHGGMLNTSGGHINPLALACGLADVVVEKGAKLYESTPAISIKRMAAGWMVSTPQGRVFADQVMLASNAYSDWFSPTLMPKVAKSLVPVVTWQMATEPQSDNIRAKILPGRQAVSDTHGDLRFFRWDERSRLITGGALILPFNGAERIRQIVGERISTIFPHMGVPKFDFVWNGRIGMSADHMPHFHQPAPGLWTWAACNGRGVALSTSLGRVFAEAMMGTSEKDLAVPITPVRTYPLHRLATLAAPAMLAYYRWRDGREPG